MRIAVFGVGGIGGYFGWRLARAGEDVVFVARGENFRVLSQKGLAVDTLDGNSVVHPVRVVGDAREAGQVDAVILGVKAWQVPEAAEAIRPIIGPDTCVVPLQNGLEAPMHLSRILGPAHVFGGLCHIVVFLVEPGHVRHAAVEPDVAFGELDNQPSRRALALREAFSHAGVKCEIPADIHLAMWEKFLFIASFSGVAAVSRAPAGIIRTVPETRQMLEEVMVEIVAVAQARGIGLTQSSIDSTMAFVDGLAPSATASMQRDVMEGRASELSEQTGAVVRLGREVGLATPLNSAIYRSLLPQELRARRQADF
ncbi:MAG: 2-dehydropantoate 2-reductase [Thermodesulfobacteriota bacterium]